MARISVHGGPTDATVPEPEPAEDTTPEPQQAPAPERKTRRRP